MNCVLDIIPTDDFNWIVLLTPGFRQLDQADTRLTGERLPSFNRAPLACLISDPCSQTWLNPSGRSRSEPVNLTTRLFRTRKQTLNHLNGRRHIVFDVNQVARLIPQHRQAPRVVELILNQTTVEAYSVMSRDVCDCLDGGRPFTWSIVRTHCTIDQRQVTADHTAPFEQPDR